MVRAIELQDNISKAPLAARLQHIQQTRADLMQQQLIRALAQEHILDHSRTRPPTPTDPAAMRIDDRERQRREQRRGAARLRGTSASSDKPAEPQDSSPAPEASSHHIDFFA